MYEEILEQMQELLKDEIKNFNGDFGKLEQMVMAVPLENSVLVYSQGFMYNRQPLKGYHK